MSGLSGACKLGRRRGVLENTKGYLLGMSGRVLSNNNDDDGGGQLSMNVETPNP